MKFNPAPPTVMHVDLNSCFATVEQQANPLFRGKPLVVAAYATGNGCILAASKEAKRLGIKTGMSVREGQFMYPRLIILPPDPDKYRLVNHQLTALLGSYTDALSVESIDEMVLDVKNTPALYRSLKKYRNNIPIIPDSEFMIQKTIPAMQDIGRDIKQRIRDEIGDWLTVSIGIAPNRYLAKVASGLEKPDGLRWITRETIEDVFSTLKLEDLCGIKEGNATRLRYGGIATPLAMLSASQEALGRAFHSIVGYHWWQRLHGWEDGVMYKTFDEKEELQKSFGQSYALPKSYTATDPRLWQILSQLTMKMGKRLRDDGCTASGVGISLLFADHTHWHTQQKLSAALYADMDFYQWYRRMLAAAPENPVRILAIYSYHLEREAAQLSLLPEDDKKRSLTAAIDRVSDRFGNFVVTPGRMLDMEQRVLDRIAFGKAGFTPLNPRG